MFAFNLFDERKCSISGVLTSITYLFTSYKLVIMSYLKSAPFVAKNKGRFQHTATVNLIKQKNFQSHLFIRAGQTQTAVHKSQV